MIYLTAAPKKSVENQSIIFLTDKFALDFKDEGGVGWDVGWRPLGPVGQRGRDGQPPLAPHLQTRNTDVPALQQKQAV